MSNLEEEGFSLCEVATSRHDTHSIGEKCNLIRTNYSKIYSNKPLNFRLKLTDYSWATIHATIQSFNNETLPSYMDKIYQISTNKKSLSDFNCSWLASCCAHTMHRFTKALRKEKIFKHDKDGYELATLCFNLLLNTTDFEATKIIFSNICYAFLSKGFSKEQQRAFDFIQDANC